VSSDLRTLVLDDVRSFVRRFVVLDDAQADTVALWIAHPHVFDAFGVTPYLAITSAEKRSGKTRLLEVLELVVREPLPTANISDAALFRVIADRLPSVLLDEIDAIFKTSGNRSSQSPNSRATNGSRPRRLRRSRSRRATSVKTTRRQRSGAEREVDLVIFVRVEFVDDRQRRREAVQSRRVRGEHP